MPDPTWTAGALGPTGGVVTFGGLLVLAARYWRDGRRERVTDAERRAADAESDARVKVSDLRGQLDRLEREARSRDEATQAELERLRDEVKGLRDQLAQQQHDHDDALAAERQRTLAETARSYRLAVFLAAHGYDADAVADGTLSATVHPDGT